MIDWDDAAQQLVEVARTGHQPTAADAARIHAALRSRYEAEPALFVAGLGGGSATGLKAIAAKAVVTLAIGGAAGVVTGVLTLGRTDQGRVVTPRLEVNASASAVRRHEPMAPNETVAAVVPSAVAAPVAARSSGDSTRRAAPELAASTPGVAPPAASFPDGLQVELAGLRRAQQWLHRGQPATTLATLAELDRANPGGVLVEERQATRVIAMCQSGTGGAREAADFARRYPGSVHLGRVREACRSELDVGKTDSVGSRH